MKKYFILTLILTIQTAALFASDADVQRYFNSGKSSYSSGAYAIAVNFFEKALALDPENELADDASYYLGMSYFMDGKYDTAIQVFNRFVNNYPDSLFREKVLFSTGNSYYKLKNYEKSVQVLRGFIKTFPDSQLVPNAHFLVAYSLLQNNKYDSAAEEFAIVAQKFPKSPFAEESLFRVGQAMTYDRDNAAAVGALGDFLAKYPSSSYRTEALYFLGKANYQREKFGEAVKAFTAAPDNMTELTNFIYHFESLYYLSMSYIRLDDYSNAVEKLERLNSLPNEFREEGLYKLGLLYKMKNRIDDAIRTFTTASSDYPKSEYTSRSLQELAACQVLQNDRDSALQTYRKIAGLGGENVPLSLVKTGELKFLTRDFTGAISVLDTLITGYMDTEYGKNALYWKARCYLEMKDYRSAITCFENYTKAEPLSPRADEISLFVGNAYVGLGDDASALVAYNAVLKMNASTYADDALLAIAWVYAKKEEYVRSIEFYEKLLKSHPKSELLPQAYYSIGIIRYNLKQYSQSLETLKKVCTLYPDSSFSGDAAVKIAWIHYKQENFETLDNYVNGLDLDRQGMTPDKKAEIYNLSGLARFRLNRYPQAIESFNRSLELTASREQVLEDMQYIAKSRFNMGDYNAAIEQYRVFIDKSRSFGLYSEIPSAIAETAWCHLKLGDQEKASSLYRELTRDYPQSPYTHQAVYKLGEYYYNLGDFQSAVSNYDTVIRIAPGTDIASSAVYWNGWSWLNLSNRVNAVNAFENYSDKYPKGDYAADAMWRTANLFFDLNNYAKAKLYFNRLVTAFPKSENIRKAKEYLGEIAIREQSGGSEEKYFQLVIQKSGDKTVRLNTMVQLAKVYHRKGRTDEAVKTLKNVMKEDSRDAGASANLELAGIYQDGEKYLDAIKLYGNTISVYKNAALYPRALYGLSYCYFKMGNTENAKKYLKNIRDKYPDTEWAKKADDLAATMAQAAPETPEK